MRSTDPLLPAVFITDYADHRALAGIGESRIIGTSFHQDELAHKVRAAPDEAGPKNLPH